MTRQDIPMDATRHWAAVSDLSPDQLIADSWYLPPEGDQSWRDQEARRIFRGDGKDEINDSGAANRSSSARDEVPVFETPATVRILLPVAIATLAMVFVTAISAPEILTARFWNSPELPPSPAPAIAPASLADAAPPVQPAAQSLAEILRPSMTDDENARAVPEPARMTDAALNAKQDDVAETPAPAADPPRQSHSGEK